MRESLWMHMLAVLVTVLIAFVIVPSVSATVAGANVTFYNSSTTPYANGTSYNAYAGNVTLIDINGFSTTQAWQGYYGNVTGTVQLADGNDNILYNWSYMNPKGQVYASVGDNNITWYKVQCFNFTATGVLNPSGEVPGSTNQKGLNLTQLQFNFNISLDAPDSVNNTFYLLGAGAHTQFYVDNLAFNDTECQSTRVYDTTGSGIAGNFQEVLLYDPASNNMIFTSLLNRDVLGFDNVTHDFEMLVLEDGHNTNTVATPYYFYLELQ